MTQDPREAPDELDQAVFECLERMEDSGPLGLEQWLAGRPEFSSALRERLRALGQVGLLGPEPAAAPPQRLGEFELLGSLGGGGMGTVWLARQQSLGREVALKVMRADQQYFPDVRRRFEREASAVSQLRHTGIVPVYAVGEFGGVPYLVMERVRGATLAEVLGELAGRDPSLLEGSHVRAALAAALARKGLLEEAERLPEFAGTWPEACAGIVEQVARALDHAHGRGVLHRDVKPSNVMLDCDGRARLFDFGLARADGSDEITASGTPVGTLPYMAPEQVSGRAMDRRTDVYGLGALLHDLLALRHPFSDEGELELRAAILSGAARGPRATNPAVPRELDSICLRALERDPQRRYEQAGALADELRAFLEHRPVRARPIGALLRARRWCQRHPARAVAVAAALAILVGTPSVVAVQRSLAAERIQRALDQAQVERQRAEANLDGALEAVAFVMGEIGDEALAEVPGMDTARERLVERSLAMLEGLLPQRSDDPDLAWRRGTLLRAHADLLDVLGRTPEAVREYEQAIELLAPRAAGGALADVQMLAGTYVKLAVSHTRSGDVRRSVELEREALALLDAVAASANDANALRLRSLIHRNLGITLSNLERNAEALSEVERACATALRLCALEDSPENRFTLAECLHDLGVVQHWQEDRVAALASYERAWPSYAERMRQERPSRLLLYRCGQLASNYAMLLGESGRHTEQTEVAALGAQAMQRLVLENPYAETYVDQFFSSLNAQAVALVAAGERERALPIFARAFELSAATAQRRVDDPEARQREAQSASNLAAALVETGRAREALAPAERAVELHEALRGEAPYLRRLDSASVRARLVLAQARLCDFEYPDAEAVELLVDERTPREPEARVLLAALMASAVQAARLDPALDDGSREDREHEYRELALLYLETALDMGYAKPWGLELSPEFDVLRDDPEFQRLLARL